MWYIMNMLTDFMKLFMFDHTTKEKKSQIK
jgi:hypothetical protein